MIRSGLVLVVLASLVACGGKESVEGQPDPATRPVAGQTPPPAPALTDFSCTVSLAEVPSEVRLGGEPVNIAVKVVNTSAAIWSAELDDRNVLGAVNVAYHWRLNGESVVEGGRSRLAADLAANQGADVSLAIVSPSKEGDYVLRVEPVQEGVAWFSDRGGCMAEAKVKAVR